MKINHIKTQKITTKFASIDDVNNIYKLQKENLWNHLGEGEMNNGFLRLDNSLKEICELIKEDLIIVAKDGEEFVGYLILITLEMAKNIEFEQQFLKNISQMEYKGKNINEFIYCILGQICIDNTYRGKDVPRLLLKAFIENFGGKYEFGIGEIDKRNARSLYVHKEKLGCRGIGEYRDKGIDRDVILLDTKDFLVKV